jgi:hypothetical protein
LENNMTTLVVQHSVAEYDTWKSSFDKHQSVRAGHGATSHRVLRHDNDLIVLLEFPDAASAGAFLADPSLHAAMETGGVIGEPKGSMVEQAELLAY